MSSILEPYVTELPEEQRAELERVWQLAKQWVPEAEEAISYGVPALKYKERPVVGFAAHANHLGLYPFSPPAIEAVREELDGFELSKGTIRFSARKPVPDAVLKRLIEFRVAEIDQTQR